MSFADVRFLNGYGMIRSNINSTQECGVVLKLKRFSHLSGRSFGLGSLSMLEALSLVLSLRDGTWREKTTWKRVTWKRATRASKVGPK